MLEVERSELRIANCSSTGGTNVSLRRSQPSFPVGMLHPADNGSSQGKFGFFFFRACRNEDPPGEHVFVSPLCSSPTSARILGDWRNDGAARRGPAQTVGRRIRAFSFLDIFRIFVRLECAHSNPALSLASFESIPERLELLEMF